MIKHVVMFKLKDFENPSEKLAKMVEIKEALEGLSACIEVVRGLRVDFNANPAEEWDLILTSVFDTLEDVGTYAGHPAHVAVGKNIIGPVRTGRACVDYIIEE
ncbi:stress responsive protein [Bacteroidia bacterium]|nr:stress responsive protein [Bacteroidia bacterium]